MPGDQNQMQSLNIDSAGLAVVHEELIKIDRSLRHHLNGQTEPPEGVSAWVLVNTRVRVTRVDRPPKKLRPSNFKARIPVIRDLIQRRQDLWAVYNDRARPHVSQSNILHLPREILGMILSNFDTDGPDRDYTQPVPDRGRDIIQTIQSLRLSCRRLHDEASHHLVPHVSIEMNPDSLEQVEKILAHPLIGHGIRGLRIIIPFYPQEMVNNFWVFTRVQASRLRSAYQTIRTMEGRERKENDDIFLPSIQTLLSQWENMFRPPHTCQQTRTMIDVAFLGYRKAHQQQFDMRWDSLQESLVQIMRRMPGITQLEIYDEPVTGRDKILGWHANSYLGLLSNLSERCMAPLKWEDYDYLGNEPVLKMADAASMRNLLVHLGTAGIRLTRLSIKTSAPRSFRGLECDADKQAALQTLAENLQYFHFWTGTQKENELRSHKALEAVNTFFSALNSSPKLRVSDVDFGGISRAGVNYHRFDPSLSKSLKKLVLRRVHIRALTLAKFFATLKAPLDLVMIGCRMVDGNWLHLMDTMKELADPAIPGGERLRLLAFKDLSGAEIDVLGRKRARKIFDEEHGRLAGKDGTKLSLAHAYILQKCNIVANPPTRKAIAELIDYD